MPRARRRRERSRSAPRVREARLILVRKGCLVAMAAAAIAIVFAPVSSSLWHDAWLALWLLAGAIYVRAIAVPAARWYRARRRTARRVRRSLVAAARELARGASRAFGPALVPALVAAAPLILLARLDLLSGKTAGRAIGIAVVLGLVAGALRAFVRQIPAAVGRLDFVFGLVCWAFIAVIAAAFFGWPAPDAGFFATAAQVNATLLVAAALVSEVPPAWRETPLAWIASGVCAMLVGLFAAIAGALGTGDPQWLFGVAMSPIAPAAAAFLASAYAHVAPDEPGTDRSPG